MKRIQKNMNKDFKYWLRWLAVLPGALFAGVLINLLILRSFLIFIDPVIADKPLNIFLFPFFIALFFVSVGSVIAPQYKLKTAIGFFGVIILMQIALAFIALPDDNMTVEIVSPSQDGVIKSIMTIAGATVGFYIARRNVLRNS